MVAQLPNPLVVNDAARASAPSLTGRTVYENVVVLKLVAATRAAPKRRLLDVEEVPVAIPELTIEVLPEWPVTVGRAVSLRAPTFDRV